MTGMDRTPQPAARTLAAVVMLLAAAAGCGGPSEDAKALKPCRTYDQVSEDWNRGDLTMRQLAGRLQEINEQAKGTTVEDEAQALVDSTIISDTEFTRADQAMSKACDEIDG